jgi:hypothetical protein
MTDDSPLTKAEFREGMTVLRGHIDERTQAVETHLRGYIDERTQTVETRLREYIDERTHDAETRLLRAFSDYQNSHNIRFAKLKADQENLDSSVDRPLASFEERVTNLDKRLILKNI